MFSEPRSAPSSDDDSQANAKVELVIRAGQIRTTSHGDWLSETREADEQSSDQLNVSARVAKIKVTKSSRSKSRDARTADVTIRTLKSGCHVESRQFETLNRIENSLAVYSIIAWRVMYLCHLGRECPDLSCEVVFSSSEWKSLCHIHGNGQVPETPPTLNEFIRLVSSFGGYVDRPKTNPGTQTLWIGLHQLHCFAIAWDTFGPGP